MKPFSQILLFFTVLSFFSCSNASEKQSENENHDPKKVAEKFYKAVNEGNFKLAIEFANTNTQDFLLKLEKLPTQSEEIPYEFIDIEKGKASYNNGDTVNINYKIGKRKENFKLVFDSLASTFKIISGVWPIRKVKLSSIDLHNLNFGSKTFDKNDKEIKARIEKDYSGLRFTITDLLLYKNESGTNIIYAIPYDKSKNFSPLPGCWNGYGWGIQISEAGTICHEMYLNDKKVTLDTTVYKGEGFSLATGECLTLFFKDNSELLDVQLESDITINKEIQIPNSWVPLTTPEAFRFKRTFNVEGNLGSVETGGEEYIRTRTRRTSFTIYYADPVRFNFHNCQIVE
ncbi:MAG: hypothetical protein ACK5B6_12095 [Bacteroidia bacterium]|jgi:hypothetical protein